jgi:hypothetical protein
MIRRKQKTIDSASAAEEFDRTMRALIRVPKREVDAIERHEKANKKITRKPMTIRENSE